MGWRGRGQSAASTPSDAAGASAEPTFTASEILGGFLIWHVEGRLHPNGVMQDYEVATKDVEEAAQDSAQALLEYMEQIPDRLIGFPG